MRLTTLVGVALIFALVAASAGLAAAQHPSQNLLKNADFGTVGPSGAHTQLLGDSRPGDAAAADWTVYDNGPGSTTTDLLPSTRRAGKSMIHVVTSNAKAGSGSGLVQAFYPVSTGPGHVVATAWVYVRAGAVFIGTGNGGNTGIDARTTTTGTWVELRARNGVSPANLIIIYGESPHADFYVDEASVEALTPEQSPDFRVTKAYLEADPIVWVGRCPTTIRFYGTISANGPGDVLYSFARSDGSYAAEPKLIFDDIGSRAVQMSWTVGNYYAPDKVYEGWARIDVRSPDGLASHKAKFSVTCKNT